jgi:hypothetical protein
VEDDGIEDKDTISMSSTEYPTRKGISAIKPSGSSAIVLGFALK